MSASGVRVSLPMSNVSSSGNVIGVLCSMERTTPELGASKHIIVFGSPIAMPMCRGHGILSPAQDGKPTLSASLYACPLFPTERRNPALLRQNRAKGE